MMDSDSYTLDSMTVRPVCSYHLFDSFAFSLGAFDRPFLGYWRTKHDTLTCQQSLAIIRMVKKINPPALERGEHLQSYMNYAYGWANPTLFRLSYPLPPQLHCEAGGEFIIGTSDESPRCSISDHTLQ
jgi:hypothetical protein